MVVVFVSAAPPPKKRGNSPPPPSGEVGWARVWAAGFGEGGPGKTRSNICGPCTPPRNVSHTPTPNIGPLPTNAPPPRGLRFWRPHYVPPPLSLCLPSLAKKTVNKESKKAYLSKIPPPSGGGRFCNLIMHQGYITGGNMYEPILL